MQNSILPETFRPLLWSYDFARIDPLKHKKTIIIQALNYGTLAHWRWLSSETTLSTMILTAPSRPQLFLHVFFRHHL
jgi:hypothetical protein